MDRNKRRLRHVVGVAGVTCTLVFATLSFASLPAGAQSVATPAVGTACPILSVGNPGPGNTIQPGDYVISGTAYDPSASSGAGISHVDLFLGERDQGGTILGSAVPGNAGTDPRAWSIQVTVPNLNRGVDFAAYADSSVTGQETAVTFPIFVGTPAKSGAATPTPIPTVTTVTSTCPSSSSAAPAAAPAAASASTPSSTGAPAAAAPSGAAAATINNGCPVLSLGNPSPGDTLNPGGYFISGTAMDPNSTSGPGVSRVDLFLGERDLGGQFLGSGIPGTGAGGNPNAFTVEVTLPNLGRTVDFAAYAISAVTGQQTIITFPVFVGLPPTRTTSVGTPTPVPNTFTQTTTCH